MKGVRRADCGASAEDISHAFQMFVGKPEGNKTI
jgi:hypothetical protein